MEYFIEQVLSWQNKLNVADAVIFTWMEVQRTWSHLESIFVCSEDIRIQLVEDSRRFDGVDAEFKVGQSPSSFHMCNPMMHWVRFIKCNLYISVHRNQKTAILCFYKSCHGHISYSRLSLA